MIFSLQKNQSDDILKRGYSFKNITIKSLQEKLPGVSPNQVV